MSSLPESVKITIEVSGSLLKALDKARGPWITNAREAVTTTREEYVLWSLKEMLSDVLKEGDRDG